jgi:hypothetical protein
MVGHRLSVSAIPYFGKRYVRCRPRALPLHSRRVARILFVAGPSSAGAGPSSTGAGPSGVSHDDDDMSDEEALFALAVHEMSLGD